MKRTILMVAAMFMMAAPMANAQIDTSLGFADIQDVNVEKARAGLKKQDAAVADAKKAAKANTWLKRANAYYAAANDPTAGVFAGLNETVLLNTVGSKVAEAGENVVVNGAQLRKYACENFDAYCQNGQIVFVVATTVIDPNALEIAYESYDKAYSLSPKVEKKVNAGMTNIMNKHIFNAQGYYGIGKLTEAASEFYKAYRASCHAAVNHPDTVDVYNAAVMATVGGDFKNGLTYVDEAIKLNYMEGGETYYYKSVCLYNLGQKEEAKEVLKEGSLTEKQLEDGMTEFKASKILERARIKAQRKMKFQGPDSLVQLYNYVWANDREVKEKGLQGFRRDTILTNMIQSLYKGQYTEETIGEIIYIPYTENVKYEVETNNEYTTTQGIKVPIFEIRAHFNTYLHDLNKQELINLIDKEEKLEHYPGLKVGSIDAPNNNAGNWE